MHRKGHLPPVTLLCPGSAIYSITMILHTARLSWFIFPARYSTESRSVERKVTWTFIFGNESSWE